MPEGPEVEGFRTVAERHLLGRTIERARFLDDWMLKDSAPSTAARRLKHRKVSAVDRRGKILGVFTDPVRGRPDTPVLALHFGMDGHPVIAEADAPVHHWDRVILDLDSGEQFRYRNSRRLGFVKVVTRNEMADLVWRLGPDPLEIPITYLREALPERDTAIKALLLDQSFLAGIGNIYADEALFAAGIRPDRAASTLTEAESDALHKAIRSIMSRAIRAKQARGRASFPLNRIRGRASKQLGFSGSVKIGCPKCTRPLRSSKIGGRTTFYCPSCQR